MMNGSFEVAAASCIGRNHAVAGKNNQDAYCIHTNELVTIAVVCDGCSSSKHSEVGAQIGARLIVEIIARQISEFDRLDWHKIERELLEQLESIAQTLAGGHSLPLIIQEYFLFTVVGAVITAEETTIFSRGDGVIALNGQIKQLGPFPDNAPPYLAYKICDQDSALGEQIQIQYQLPTLQVESIVLGTDGVNDSIAKEEHFLPGKEEKVGAIAQFWQQDRYFHNPDALRRRLFLMNREVTKPDWHDRRLLRQGGLLPDDTTLIVIRRRGETGRGGHKEDKGDKITPHTPHTFSF